MGLKNHSRMPLEFGEDAEGDQSHSGADISVTGIIARKQSDAAALLNRIDAESGLKERLQTPFAFDRCIEQELAQEIFEALPKKFTFYRHKPVKKHSRISFVRGIGKPFVL